MPPQALAVVEAADAEMVEDLFALLPSADGQMVAHEMGEGHGLRDAAVLDHDLDHDLGHDHELGHALDHAMEHEQEVEVL